jgi:hypothetical protein
MSRCRGCFQGSGDEDTRPLVLRHFQRVDHALRELLGGDQAPLVLAGVCYLRELRAGGPSDSHRHS